MTVATEPLRDSLLERAQADAAGILAHADEVAARLAAEAEATARALLADARDEGHAAATLETAQERTDARRRARALVLAAQRRLWEELGAAARAAVRARADEALAERLVAAARRQLGDEAVVQRDAGGGVRATAGARHVDYTLDALVDRCLAQLGSAATELWR